ncbi:MAG: hypothetical protein LBS62_05645 [Clostridiales bacterium]|jgi:hypothetical protein|nr:hypothetical protein [Clostridiales bacterium]
MWDFLGTVVKALPPWFVMALIVFLAAAALCLLPRVRRDKNGKLYLFSRSYEYQKNRVKEQSEAVKSLCDRMDGLTERMDGLSEKVLAAEKSREEGRSMQLKLVITNPELPAYLRSEAYEEYSTVLKKNGWVKAYFEENVRPLLRRQAKSGGR